jgi:hypothetical protein
MTKLKFPPTRAELQAARERLRGAEEDKIIAELRASRPARSFDTRTLSPEEARLASAALVAADARLQLAARAPWDEEQLATAIAALRAYAAIPWRHATDVPANPAAAVALADKLAST